MKHSVQTKLIQTGTRQFNQSIINPIFQSAIYEYDGNSYGKLKYSRFNNTPNHITLSRKLALLENAEAAIVTASGMSAISTTLFSILKAGDHILISDGLYGGTYYFVLEDLSRFNVQFDFVNLNEPGTWREKIRPNTRAFYVEGIANPLSGVGDLEEVVRLSRAFGLISVIDNTIPTPYNFKAVEFGFDLSLHSCTKYLNGHSDIVAGAILGSASLVEKISHTLLHFGGTLDPHTCFLLERGLKTFPLRMKYQNESALRIANFLHNHPKVRVVHFPGLESHTGHKLAKNLFSGFSGFMSFELHADLYQTKQFISNLTIPIESVSLGGPETLIIQPAATTHSLVEPVTRMKMGISDTLIRLSVGLEDTNDLIDDISSALEQI